MTEPALPNAHHFRHGEPIDLADLLAPYSQAEHPLYRRGLRRGFWWGTVNAALWVLIFVVGGFIYRAVISP